jgi:hypothetical protein
MKFNRDSLKVLREDLENALKQVAEKHGIQATVGSASFTANNIVWKIELAVKDESGNAIDRHAEAFKVLATSYGLKPEDLGREFVVSGVKYQLKGINTRSRKFPVVADCITDGKSYAFPVVAVKSAFGYR